MKYKFAKEVLDVLGQYEAQSTSPTLAGFSAWLQGNPLSADWEGKATGRTVDSILSTLLVHMGRYAKAYSRSVIQHSNFASQDEFIYLITLNAGGPMTKMALIKKNVQDKSSGIQTIQRLIDKGWIIQTDSETDKRSKVIRISEEGTLALQEQMAKIRQASRIVGANLSEGEKTQLVTLLQKLDSFHQIIYEENWEVEELLDRAETKLSAV
jgi:DNA-binding MarR family transcriptional regulator